MRRHRGDEGVADAEHPGQRQRIARIEAPGAAGRAHVEPADELQDEPPDEAQESSTWLAARIAPVRPRAPTCPSSDARSALIVEWLLTGHRGSVPAPNCARAALRNGPCDRDAVQAGRERVTAPVHRSPGPSRAENLSPTLIWVVPAGDDTYSVCGACDATRQKPCHVTENGSVFLSGSFSR